MAPLRSPARQACWTTLAALTLAAGWAVLEAAPAETAAAPAARPVPPPMPLSSTAPPAPRTELCPDTARACVDEERRVAWLQHDGEVTHGPVAIMPGDPGAPDSVATPRGVFRVEWKDAEHTSAEFGDPMNHSVFFAPGGIAFHEGSLDTPSHGCVHLSARDAALFYDALPVGAEVAVF
ncbi:MULTISPECIES: L,D-transpeptidase [Amycolatopsis]|uniref:L,D-transpeptidase n=1 Tax=Amycolatopsis thermalba TaxID=944492 RepID=A0ABY4NWR4_9PSEU|nr:MULTISPECIES: L,D-transpeptidase [Amycolatopsis]OXM64302.1 L,D-transpeptidase [Amycolatopsis sp. KNN50.9b]UQS24488.1 L,D-transpeptidase [Amycolatopsis thermalba]